MGEYTKRLTLVGPKAEERTQEVPVNQACMTIEIKNPELS